MTFAPPIERCSVLVVDDEEGICKAVRRELRRSCDVTVASSGEEALAELHRRPVHVVLADQRMPGMCGTALLARVRAEAPDLGRLLMTGYADIQTVIEAINTGGVHGYLTKPWDRARLAEAVEDGFGRYRAAEALRRRLGEAEVSQRAYEDIVRIDQAKDRLMGMVAHDLRTPLSVIQGTGAQLARDPSAPEHARRWADRILRSSELAARLLDDLLDLVSIEQGGAALRCRAVDLPALVAAVVASLEPLARRKSIAVVADLPAGLPPVTCDPDRVTQILDNLVENAIKFSPSDTAVTVRATPAEAAVRIAVVDQGPGLAPEDIDRIFQRFAPGTTPTTGGEKHVGLGLSICKALVEKHGGTIGVESTKGRGATFFFTLPM